MPPAKAVVVGGGTMGAGVAAAFLQAGWSVELVEQDPAARETLPQRLRGLLPQGADGGAWSRRLGLRAGLSAVDWAGAAIVSESVCEDLAAKRAVFAELVACAPAGIPLTSNSSTLFARDIAAGLPRAAEVMNLHFLMPAHLVPLVEVLATPDVAPAIAEAAMRIARDIGKKPVRLSQALPGFLVNRIQAALMREALALVDAGVASAQDVDAAVRWGFGFRYAACGPLLQKEHSGWDISHAVYRAVFPTLCNDAGPAPLLQGMVDRGRTGMKAGAGFVAWDGASMACEQERFQRAMQAARQVALGEPGDAVPPWTG